jgi:hypothetical protein
MMVEERSMIDKKASLVSYPCKILAHLVVQTLLSIGRYDEAIEECGKDEEV